MIDLGLRARELEQLKELLVTSHRLDVYIQILTMEHKYVADASRMLLGGQVTIDATATESTRALTLELLDPAHKLKLDGEAPDDGSVHYDRMAKVVYSVSNFDRTFTVDIPVFCGPITKASRSGPVISIEGLGKDKLAMSSVWKSKTYKRNTSRFWVIKDLLKTVAGERKLSIPTPKKAPRLPGKFTVNRESTPWAKLQRVASSMNRQLFYNGRGVAVLRKRPQKSVYTFTRKGALQTAPQINFDASGLVNAVHVIGAKPKKAKKKIQYKIVAPRRHPLSPWKLGRWGVPRYVPETIEDSSIKSRKEARRIGKARLKNALIESVDVTFDSLPIPFLEEGDMCTVVGDDFSMKFRLQKMTIPLTADGVSSVGYLRRVTPNPRQIKIKNRGRKKRNRA